MEGGGGLRACVLLLFEFLKLNKLIIHFLFNYCLIYKCRIVTVIHCPSDYWLLESSCVCECSGVLRNSTSYVAGMSF